MVREELVDAVEQERAERRRKPVRVHADRLHVLHVVRDDARDVGSGERGRLCWQTPSAAGIRVLLGGCPQNVLVPRLNAIAVCLRTTRGGYAVARGRG